MYLLTSDDRQKLPSEASVIRAAKKLIKELMARSGAQIQVSQKSEAVAGEGARDEQAPARARHGDRVGLVLVQAAHALPSRARDFARTLPGTLDPSDVASSELLLEGDGGLDAFDTAAGLPSKHNRSCDVGKNPQYGLKILFKTTVRLIMHQTDARGLARRAKYVPSPYARVAQVRRGVG